ncbi:MAG: hypothetical protein H8D23_14310, partial [Candidatus Brocadiales bacterium]|nr:hypothetical protein [Candidatus Brocadiales bacterium]
MSNIYYTDTDNTIHLGKEIGRGGEGKVYLVHGYLSDVAKIYARQQPPEIHRKILSMVQNPPHDPTVNGPTKHRSIAWPSDILYLDRQKTKFAGFIMPRVDMKVFVKLLYYISPDDRVKTFQGGFTWLHLYTTGFNLASCLAAIHERGYCVGDINESNILVAPTTPLTIIDCDSFQIEDPSSKRLWRCKVGKVDYTAPEILDYRYEDIDRTKETDCFALAIILFQLLMEGFHPYAASGKLVDDAPTTRDKIKKGIFPYTRSMKGIAPPRDAPPFDILYPDIQDLFHRCFQIGHKNSTARPTAKEWMQVFKKTSQHFKKCTANENHRFLDHLSTCPWCDKVRKTGKDSFPSPVGQQIILPDPTSQTVSLEDRKAWLLPYIEMALVDGYISREEKEYLIDQGLKLHISEKVTKKLIESEVQKRGALVKTVSGRPKLELSKTSFDFPNIRKGSSVTASFIISNVGGGTLSGPIKTNKKWLKVSQSNIDTTRHKQDITFYVEPSGLPFGFKDTGTIEIQSNCGAERVFVDFSLEMPEADLSRFRSGLTIGGLILGGLFGYFIYNLSLIQGMNVNVAGIAGIVALVGAVIATGKIGYQDGGGGAAFAGGCGTLIVGIIILAVLESYFPHAFSTFSWTLAYGSFANILSTPIRKALWRGNLRTPVTVGAVTIALTGGIIIVGFISAKDERDAEFARSKAIKKAIQTTRSKLIGEWHGKLDRNETRLFITRANKQLSGKMIYGGIEEKLSVNLKNNDGKIVIVLKGTNYKRLKGKGRFYLDTFYGTLSGDGRSIKGEYIDTAKRKGKWSVLKLSPR